MPSLLCLGSITPSYLPALVDAFLTLLRFIYPTLCRHPPYPAQTLLEQSPAHHAEAQHSPTPLFGPHFLVSLSQSGFDIQLWTVLLMDTFPISFGIWHPMWPILPCNLSHPAWVLMSCACFPFVWESLLTHLCSDILCGLPSTYRHPLHPSHTPFPSHECFYPSCSNSHLPSLPQTHTDLSALLCSS